MSQSRKVFCEPRTSHHPGPYTKSRGRKVVVGGARECMLLLKTTRAVGHCVGEETGSISVCDTPSFQKNSPALDPRPLGHSLDCLPGPRLLPLIRVLTGPCPDIRPLGLWSLRWASRPRGWSCFAVLHGESPPAMALAPKRVSVLTGKDAEPQEICVQRTKEGWEAGCRVEKPWSVGSWCRSIPEGLFSTQKAS